MLLDLNLSDLDNPYKCAKWISNLPRYKSNFVSILGIKAVDQFDQDIACCSRISQFIYQQQMDGNSFSKGFTEQDFNDMLQCIFSSKLEYENSLWIWNIIDHLQRKQKQKAISNAGWIPSSWNRLTVLEQEKHRNSDPVSSKIIQFDTDWSQTEDIDSTTTCKSVEVSREVKGNEETLCSESTKSETYDTETKTSVPITESIQSYKTDNDDQNAMNNIERKDNAAEAGDRYSDKSNADSKAASNDISNMKTHPYQQAVIVLCVVMAIFSIRNFWEWISSR